MISNTLKLSAAAAAVAAVFAAPAQATVIVGAGSSALNAGLYSAVINDDCTAGTVVFYDNSTSAPTKLANGTVYTVSCTPVASGRFTSPTLNVSYDTTGGSWKAFTATTPAFFATAQAANATDPLSYVKTIDPATTTGCTQINNFTSTLTTGLAVTVTYQWGCSSAVVDGSAYGSGTNSDTTTFGLTDVEAKLFANSTENQPLVYQSWNSAATPLLSPFTLGTEFTGFGTGATGGIKVFGVVFGIAASGPLYGAMQNDQLLSGVLPAACGSGTSGSTAIVSTSALCAPIISKSQYSSIMAVTGGGALQSAALLFKNPSAYGDLSYEWARRDKGSGSQASANAYFLNDGCSTSATESPDATNLPLNDAQNGGGDALIISYSPSTTDVTNRLQGISPSLNGETYAFPTSDFVIGTVAATTGSKITSTGAFGTSSAAWGFLSLEGAQPTVANTQAGTYSYAVTEYLHCSPSASGDGAQLCKDLGGLTSGATSLITFSTENQSGVYPIAAANGGVYANAGKTCSGLRHL
jgi:hypothetical protein